MAKANMNALASVARGIPELSFDCINSSDDELLAYP
jgi:hypothetical protein